MFAHQTHAVDRIYAAVRSSVYYLGAGVFIREPFRGL